MPLDPRSVGYVSAPVHVTWDEDDVMLYALSLGAGSEALERTTENTAGQPLRAYPWMPVVHCQPPDDVWDAIGPFDWTGLVHARQDVDLHAPFPTTGSGHAVTTVESLQDKGTAAIVQTRTVLTDDDGTELATGHGMTFIRGAGGWGGERGSSASQPRPERAPDHVATLRTFATQPLLYRINADRNPLHSDPAFAAEAGFERPIMHGLCSLGMSLRSILTQLPEDQQIASFGARFTKPVMPGDEITTSLWHEGADLRFEAESAGSIVLADGVVRLRDGASAISAI